MAQSMARLVNFWNDQPAAAGLRDADLGQQLAGFQRALEQAPEEVRGRDLPDPGRSAGDEHRVQRQHDRGQVGGRVRVGQRPADRAAVPDLRIADLAGRVGEQRQLSASRLDSARSW